MKKIFSIISVLIFLSLIGLIFFEYLWIKQALKDKEHQLEEHLIIVTAAAGNNLIDQKGNLYPFENKKNNDAFSPLNISPPTITHKFSRDEIRSTIQNAFDKHDLKNLPFEFAITNARVIALAHCSIKKMNKLTISNGCRI